MVIISEFGFPGIFAKTPTEADATRVSILREQLPLLAKRDWIAGAILWCYQDYKSRRYFWPGQEQGYLEHGIVDQYRQRKPSYFAWADLNEPAHVDARWTRSTNGEPAAFAFTMKPNGATELPSYPLRDYRVTWQLVDADNKAVADGAALVSPEGPLSIERDVPTRTNKGAFKLVIKLVRPDGSLAMEHTLASQ
jgi:beta-glucuronidase